MLLTLSSIHNLYFIVNLVKKIRESILDDTFFEYKRIFKNYRTVNYETLYSGYSL